MPVKITIKLKICKNGTENLEIPTPIRTAVLVNEF